MICSPPTPPPRTFLRKQRLLLNLNVVLVYESVFWRLVGHARAFCVALSMYFLTDMRTRRNSRVCPLSYLPALTQLVYSMVQP